MSDVVRWRVQNGLFLNTHYQAQAADDLSGAWSNLEQTAYQILSVIPVAAGFSELEVFVPDDGPVSFLRPGFRPSVRCAAFLWQTQMCRLALGRALCDPRVLPMPPFVVSQQFSEWAA